MGREYIRGRVREARGPPSSAAKNKQEPAIRARRCFALTAPLRGWREVGIIPREKGPATDGKGNRSEHGGGTLRGQLRASVSRHHTGAPSLTSFEVMGRGAPVD